MNSNEPEQVDQALFGYSDGHRQIEASVRLPSKDQYQLAAATDLAAGARLNPDDSYLTGLPLRESRRFALIRTWPAPEMARLGCVWSHVILIDFRLLSSHGDLSDFLGMLSRPEKEASSSYGEPLTLPLPRRRAVYPDRRTLFDLVGQYYSGERVVLRPDVAPQARDAAIFAMWSQQWPGLRSSFSFRTAQGDDSRRSELIDYNVQVGGGGANSTSGALSDSTWPTWVVAAAEDALTTCVTTLRRFLWRYGRDLVIPRAHFRTLVELYLALQDSEGRWADAAVRIFESLPEAGDGEILKGDILGIGSASPSLIPALPPAGLLQLLASKRLQALITPDQMRKRFEAIPPDQVADLATFVVRHREALGPWEEALNAGLVSSATRESLTGVLPGGIRKLILMSRPELIDGEAVTPLPNEDLMELASAHRESEAARILASAIVRRDFGSSNAKVFGSMPSLMFDAAIDATRSHEVNPAWAHVIGEHSDVILETDWPAGTGHTVDLAIGLSLLRFPRNNGKPLELWAKALASSQDDVLGEDRVRLQAFMLREALEAKTPTTWRLVGTVLPELRTLILGDALPNDVYQMLVNDLPKFNGAAYWDLDKRILLSLSQLRKTTPDEEALGALDLSEEDAHTVMCGEEDEAARSKSGFWWF